MDIDRGSAERISALLESAIRELHESIEIAQRTLSEADYEAFKSAAGGWKDLVDTEKLKRDISESRKISTRPPIEL